MRSLEVHLFETDQDLDSAIQCGTMLPEQLASSSCTECDGKVGFEGLDGFEPFVCVIDENDQDWIVCGECAGPIIDYVDAFFPPVTKSHFIHEDPEDLDYF